METCQISGASGFVGSNLQSYLANDFVVLPLSVRYKKNQIIELNADHIIHAAGKAHELKHSLDDSAYYKANYELTKQLFDAFLGSNSKTFIFISSVKAVTDKVAGLLTEESRAHPLTSYGKSKKLAEDYIQSHIIPEGKQVFILRPCMIHGKGNKGNLNLLFKIVSKGFPWPLGSFENKRSFLSVENLCYVIKELLNRTDIPSGIYNLADDDAISTNELIQIMGNSLNKKTVIWKIPVSYIKIIARVGDFLALPLHSKRLEKLTESYLVDNAKIKHAMGKELPVCAREGLLNTLKSFNK
ncbi:NAD-dependent epimerase/dehydratase family protein [Flavobacterium franklandianum]|uniref:NAD-dependent epimerase/dehydratase family protein n=1 Tax=Flavobacterium franklandianum TaxID=2594430 RepID=A0A553CK49_9FLAO|nr:NAD-dependent epimerase/dehydratase family protein [Flavobacterium franklandianum]TRX20874.1 NAD-dependent epimerase/dehydratase family protein [Flavobacterium franklandianum]TRX29454.1 NAD-dependent epimerase/dehydratase family protein [Flavobacterium franklandianum]